MYFFIQGVGFDSVVLTLYVDDLLIFSSTIEQIDETKRFLAQTFEIKDMGCVDTILGIKVIKKDSSIILSQSHYVDQILHKFNFSNCRPSPTPISPNIKVTRHYGSPIAQSKYASIIGSLMFLMIVQGLI